MILKQRVLTPRFAGVSRGSLTDAVLPGFEASLTALSDAGSGNVQVAAYQGESDSVPSLSLTTLLTYRAFDRNLDKMQEIFSFLDSFRSSMQTDGRPSTRRET